LFYEDVELLVDGVAFPRRGRCGRVWRRERESVPGLYIASERIMRSSPTASEIDVVTGHPASGHSRLVGTPMVCFPVGDVHF
jgi:hypothetical protein